MTNLSSSTTSTASFGGAAPRFDLFFPARIGLPAKGGRLGVLGGAYNPITRAHLVLSHSAVQQFGLHEVVFVLSKISPHKPLVGASIEQRLEMMRLGTNGVPYISVGLCTHGLFLDICAALKQAYPQNPDLFFIVGRDAAERLLTWPYHDRATAMAQMFACFRLLVFPRQGKPRLPNDTLIKQYASGIHTLRLSENIDLISSTRVRQRIRAGEPSDDLVPEKVAAFIRRHNIYKDLPND